MSTKTYKSTILQAKQVENKGQSSMINVPIFKFIADTFEKANLLENECVDIADKKIKTAGEISKTQIYSKITNQIDFVKRYIKKSIKEAKNSNGCWVQNNILANNELESIKNAEKSIAKDNAMFKNALKRLENLKNIKDRKKTLEEDLHICILTIEIEQEVQNYFKKTFKNKKAA